MVFNSQALEKIHKTFESDMEAENSRVNGLETIATELSELSYHNIDAINARVQSIKENLANLKQLSDDRRARIQEAIANQQKLDSLRLEFATNSAVSDLELEWRHMSSACVVINIVCDYRCSQLP